MSDIDKLVLAIIAMQAKVADLLKIAVAMQKREMEGRD